MCGIVALFQSQGLSQEQLRNITLKSSKLLRHRGPDWSGMYIYYQPSRDTTRSSSPQGSGLSKITTAALAHERLSIVGVDSGAQPLYNKEKTIVLTINGELYNHKVIRADPEIPYDYQTTGDCEIVIPLYAKYGFDCVHKLDGMFAFVLWDETSKSFFAARDPIGILPLYIGYRADGGIVFASELKALQVICERFELFPPGHYYSSTSHEFVRYYNPIWMDGKYSSIPKPLRDQTFDVVLKLTREKFEKAVTKRMMTEVPWGVLLSGGLDSSLVSSVACRHAIKEVKDWPTIHSFSVGLIGSPDLAAAEKVAKFLGTKHHAFTFTVQDGLDAVADVIYHLETYDVTTIRAATPMYLMARKIKALGVKMVLSGEGADECLGGYLYFHKAPSKEAFHEETVEKLKKLHYYDCLRANKSMSAFGVEPRVPFLDKDWLDFIMTIDTQFKMCEVRKGDENRGSIEKFLLRKAFDDKENPFLPEEVLWRQKEQFSDGVGYSWIDALREKAEREVSPTQWGTRGKRFPVNTPATKEAYVYRTIFQRHFPGESARDTVLGGPSIACSTPAAIEWDESFKKLATEVGGENSGRAVAGVHNQAYGNAADVVSGRKKATDFGENGEPSSKRVKK